METKKSNEKKLDSLRMPLALTGFLFTGGLILASFSYVTPVEQELLSNAGAGEQVVNFVQEEQQDTQEEQQEQMEDDFVAPPTQNIDTLDNVVTPPVAAITVPRPPVPTGPRTPRTPPAELILFPDVEAAFPGGQTELSKYIVNNIVYPDISIQMEEQGKVYLSFIVEKDGSISRVKVERGVSDNLDREAKRIVRAMPKWEAGEVGGKKVRTKCSLPIVFTLH